MRKSKLFLFTFGCFYCLLFAHANQISVNPIPLNEQLPSNTVQRVFQDKEGFMWFATLDGLCRYDAYRILVFRSDLNHPDLLTNNEITCFAEDNNGHLLIGTKKGVNILDKKTYQIKHFKNKEVYGQEIKSILVTSDGNIWIGTINQVYRFNADFSFAKQYEDSLPITSVNSFYEDKDGILWVMLWRNGLHKYDKSTDSFIRFPVIGTIDNPFKIFQDSKNQLWIGTWGDGLYLFYPQKNKEEMYIHKEIFIEERQSQEDTFFSFAQDELFGYIWVMSISGLHALKYTEDGKTKEVDISYLFSDFNNIFSEIIKDISGNLWIGTFSEGVLVVSFNKPVIHNYTMPSIKKRTGITPNITTIYKDREGDIWFNQNRWGLTFFKPSANTISFYQDNPALQTFTELNNVKCISDFRSIPGTIWVGPENESAIYCLKKEKGNILFSGRIDLQKISPHSGNPRLFYEDRRNNIWITTTTGILIRPYNKENIQPVSFSLGTITGITEDTRSSIWISSKNAGIYQIPLSRDVTTNKTDIIHYDKETSNLISNNIEAISADISGNIWIGTKEGNIIVYDIINQTFNDMSNSFKMIGEGILNIIADDFGHVWVSTNKRIIEYNSRNRASRNYSAIDGVAVSSFVSNSYYKDKSGELFFGGNNGISIFTLSEALSQPPKKVKALISDVKINNQSIYHDNNNQRLDMAKQTLTFKPDDKNIEIYFSSLDYTFSSKIHYAYKMEGVDDDWVYTENNRQFAIYNYLKKGHHNFYIKATDENNLWNDEVTLLKIYKRPAFYETGWAYIFYIAFILLLITFVYIWIRNRIKLQNELKIAQIEKEKSEELTQVKLRYFTNITHDFLTPLTILSCLIDDAEITYKGKIKQFETMRSSISRLRRLLQQILDFRKVESGSMKLTLSQGDIVTFIKNVCYTNFIPLMKKKDIHFLFHSNPNQIPAYFDVDKIDKIVFNMLSNAFKYTHPNGEVKVELEQYTKGDHTYLSIKISDTGIGIAPEDLKNIFTRFYNHKISIAGETNGIGLSLTKDLVELHHGSIHVNSKVNEGTVFIIEIPIDRASYNDLEVGGFGQIRIAEKTVDLMLLEEREFDVNMVDNLEKELINVLLVEDNEELLSLISNLLSKHYHVITAKNGREALSIIKENSNNINIIISDVMMPEMDGLELCIILKKELETSHIPIILLTAKDSADDRVECYNAGADGYIAKPFDLKVLEARIRNFIENKKSRQKDFQKDIEVNISKLDYPTIDEQFLIKAVKVIEDNLSEVDLDVNFLAGNLLMSKSSLYRKIKTMTGLSPVEFIRNIRLKHACQMLKDKSISISEVAYATGFSDPKYFTTCFKNEFDVTPSDFQKGSNMNS